MAMGFTHVHQKMAINRISICFKVLAFAFVFVLSLPTIQAQSAPFELKIEQVTAGTKHHFFGYIGQCRTIPWNGFVNGHKQADKNYYTVYRRSDGSFARSEGVYKGPYDGDIRIDPAPRWNRTNSAIGVPGIAKNKTRQMFVIHVVTDRHEGQ
jgi:hypothetical protein